MSGLALIEIKEEKDKKKQQRNYTITITRRYEADRHEGTKRKSHADVVTAIRVKREERKSHFEPKPKFISY